MILWQKLSLLNPLGMIILLLLVLVVQVASSAKQMCELQACELQAQQACHNTTQHATPLLPAAFRHITRAGPRGFSVLPLLPAVKHFTATVCCCRFVRIIRLIIGRGGHTLHGRHGACRYACSTGDLGRQPVLCGPGHTIVGAPVGELLSSRISCFDQSKQASPSGPAAGVAPFY